jgi:hypothetical protein
LIDIYFKKNGTHIKIMTITTGRRTDGRIDVTREIDGNLERNSWLPGTSRKLWTNISLLITNLILAPCKFLVDKKVFPNKSQFLRVAVINFMRELGYNTKKLENDVKNSKPFYVQKNDRKSKVDENPIPVDVDLVDFYVEKIVAMGSPPGLDIDGVQHVTFHTLGKMRKVITTVSSKKNGFVSRSEFVRMAGIVFLKKVGWLVPLLQRD